MTASAVQANAARVCGMVRRCRLQKTVHQPRNRFLPGKRREPDNLEPWRAGRLGASEYTIAAAIEAPRTPSLKINRPTVAALLRGRYPPAPQGTADGQAAFRQWRIAGGTPSKDSRAIVARSGPVVAATKRDASSNEQLRWKGLGDGSIAEKPRRKFFQSVPSSSMAARPPSLNPFITGFCLGSDWAMNTVA
jgi:hypothetical protein